MRRMLKEVTTEDWFVVFFGLSFFVGVWYALPMVNNSTDVWPFGGGVLRAIEAHTLLPGYGVAYGTLSFYQNYVLMVLALCIGYVALGFDIEALKTLLVLNPSYSLVVPRVASILTAIVLLGIIYRFLKIQVLCVPWRLVLLMLVFGNVLTALLVRSGKMWLLSMCLGVISFIYLYRAITEESKGLPGRLSAVSIIAAFLAVANFTFAAIFLINVPILLYAFAWTRAVINRFALMVGVGALVFLAVFALNAANTIEQVSGFVLQFFSSDVDVIPRVQATLTVFESFMVNARQAVESFPLLLLALIPAVLAGVRDRVLASLAMIYIVVYMIAVSVVFRVDDGLALNVRHIFPIGFYLLFLLAAHKPYSGFVSVSLFLMGSAFYVYTLILLSMPTTYNAAYDFIAREYGQSQIRIDEHIFELTLPMNKESYALFTDFSCGSTCRHMRAREDDIAFRPLVVTGETDPALLATLPPPDLVIVERAIFECTPIVQFTNNVPDDEIFDIDINLGRMLMPSFYKLHRLGKNIYVYESRSCPKAKQSSED